MVNELKDAFRLGSAFDTECRIVRPNGEERVIQLHGEPLLGDADTAQSMAGIVLDISEHWRLEQTLRHAQKMEGLGNLAGGIAHEINNMLIPITILSSSAIKTLPESRQERKHLGSVLQAAEQVKALVNKILTFSRQDLGELVEIDVSEVVRETMDLVGSTMPSTISLTQDVDGYTGKILADRSQISSILFNLTSNSFDAMEGRTGELEVSLSAVNISEEQSEKVADLKAGTYAQLSVSDTGAGIDNETLQWVLDPFFTTKDVGKGTGMGLSIVYGIVLNHGGALDIASDPGTGTTVPSTFRWLKGKGRSPRWPRNTARR